MNTAILTNKWAHQSMLNSEINMASWLLIINFKMCKDVIVAGYNLSETLNIRLQYRKTKKYAPVALS